MNTNYRNAKFICFIDTSDSPAGSLEEQKNFDLSQVDGLTFNEDYRKRLVENNFELMNGTTIQVTCDKS